MAAKTVFLHDEPCQRARDLYWQDYSLPQIADALQVNINTLYTWRRRDGWDSVPGDERVLRTLRVQVLRLSANTPLSAGDMKQMDFLTRQIERLEKAQAAGGTGEKKKKGQKNHFTPEQTDKLRKLVLEPLYAHQKRWYRQRKRRNRMILKSRQIGATWYFAREALLTALETGRNQIFLSASRMQAFEFKDVIIELAEQVSVELKGGKQIKLSNGARLYFLGTYAATAQTYHGDLYFDEFFWTVNFLNLRKAAAAMASHKGLRKTYFSTPTSEAHAAYPFWTGGHYNEGRPKKEHITSDVSHAALKDGRLCEDAIWRQIVTLEDTVAQGFDLIDPADVQQENSPQDYANLYSCQFVKPGERAFDFNTLVNCAVDGYDVWPDWRPYYASPLGERGVVIGADPTGTGDNGDGLGLAVLVPPLTAGAPWRVLEAIQYRGMAFEKQSEVIRQLAAKYHVEGIVIDGTGGTGEAVHELVSKWFPAAVLLRYSAPLKRQMVLKAQMLLRTGRLEYDAGLRLIADSFMTIEKVVTTGGIVTYKSARTRGIDHGDIAWAIMNVLLREPLGSDTGGSETRIWEF